MFSDIPYYLSNHKHKMISALVTEANRVYRLWCRNNPKFGQKGRVHLIAHSLGSVMVMLILILSSLTLCVAMRKPYFHAFALPKHMRAERSSCDLHGGENPRSRDR